MQNDREIKPGDKISALGYTFTVGKVLYMEYFGPRDEAGASDCWGYDVEFTDTAGRYHHWKQNQDHGYAMRGDERHGYIVFGADGCMEPGHRIKIRWTENGRRGWAEVDYIGRDSAGGYRFRSVLYGWIYTLDVYLQTIRNDQHPDEALPVDNSTGWLRLVP